MVKGFPLVVYTDHKNNLFTGALLANKRINKKLLRWSLDVEEYGERIQRVWLKGTDNILGDAPSRNTSDRNIARQLPVPSGPVRRVMKAMFEKPIELDEEFGHFNRFGSLQLTPIQYLPYRSC